jgi:copper-containing nitrite reductase
MNSAFNTIRYIAIEIIGKLALAFGFLCIAAGTDAMTVMARAQGRASHTDKVAQTIKAADIVRDPSDLPPPIGERAPAVVKVTLTSKELVGALDPASGTTYRYWTFDGKVPAPFIRVRQGDTVEVTLVNPKDSTMVHSLDFHAAIGPGGGAALTQVPPGQSKTFSFQATTPGLFVYHCGSPMIAQHIANGMYGLILVEPPGGLSHVDHEYYLMQGEIYTTAPKGRAGLQQFSPDNLMAENAQYYLFNGAVDAITKEYPLHANEGETVRIYFGNAGPNATASEHMVGEIFTWRSKRVRRRPAKEGQFRSTRSCGRPFSNTGINMKRDSKPSRGSGTSSPSANRVRVIRPGMLRPSRPLGRMCGPASSASRWKSRTIIFSDEYSPPDLHGHFAAELGITGHADNVVCHSGRKSDEIGGRPQRARFR